MSGQFTELNLHRRVRPRPQPSSTTARFHLFGAGLLDLMAAAGDGCAPSEQSSGAKIELSAAQFRGKLLFLCSK
jgi:hypothetical protein